MSNAPDAALAKAPDWGGAWRSCTTTAATLKAAAVRKTAPTLAVHVPPATDGSPALPAPDGVIQVAWLHLQP